MDINLTANMLNKKALALLGDESLEELSEEALALLDDETLNELIQSMTEYKETLNELAQAMATFNEAKQASHQAPCNQIRAACVIATCT
ncbi:MAG: hypothetical protein FWG02_01035 [Holophagaceae bacterium]|nr:hypothetical protein [Holophagaceae bacterium]